MEISATVFALVAGKESWGLNRHTLHCISAMSMVSQSMRVIEMEISATVFALVAGKDLRFYFLRIYLLHVRSDGLWVWVM